MTSGPTEVIKSITNIEQFPKIFSKYFQKNVYFKTRAQNIHVTFAGYKDGIVEIRSKSTIREVGQCHIYVRFQENVISTQLKLVKKGGQDVYYFRPLKIQVLKLRRSEDRKKLTDPESKTGEVLYVTEIISDFKIIEQLKYESKKVSAIRENSIIKHTGRFEKIKMFELSDGHFDPRMKYFYDTIEPIYIKNRNNPPSNELETYYNNFVIPADTELSNAHYLTSEVTVPLLIKAMIPFGYIQINNSSELTRPEFMEIRKLATSLSEVFIRNNIFKISDDQVFLSDISKSGFGLRFKERVLIRNFKQGSLMYCSLYFPENTKAQILVEVKYINILENSLIKVGCEVKNIDALGEVYRDEFIEKG